MFNIWLTLFAPYALAGQAITSVWGLGTPIPSVKKEGN